jgi:hypothetical protein
VDNQDISLELKAKAAIFVKHGRFLSILIANLLADYAGLAPTTDLRDSNT